MNGMENTADYDALQDWAEAMAEWLDAHPDHDMSAEDVVGNALARAAVLRRSRAIPPDEPA
jgi:hypothetical protein